ncbi:hypothetical protein TWF506_005200 [Arthrobotrys conoides]|uniref:Uncharacterized protein n=1 Tax=Arthrobotrys conoides TaxID=74498 RepID=A0AAN8RVV5_9PEZI
MPSVKVQLEIQGTQEAAPHGPAPISDSHDKINTKDITAQTDPIPEPVSAQTHPPCYRIFSIGAYRYPTQNTVPLTEENLQNVPEEVDYAIKRWLSE